MRVVEIETQDRQRRYVVIDEEGMLAEPIVRRDQVGLLTNYETPPLL